MKRSVSLLCCLVIGLLVLACSGGIPDSRGLTVRLPPLYVDGQHGDDQNAGTSEAPFKTITHALEVAGEGRTIQVAPWVYDAKHGEVFPLRIPAAVHLIGDPANRGAEDVMFPTLILGAGMSRAAEGDNGIAVLPGEGVHIEGFGIMTSRRPGGDGQGIVITNESVVVSKCTIQDCDYGIVFVRDPVLQKPPQTGTVFANTIRHCGTGLNVAPGVGPVLVYANWIHHNDRGVLVSLARPDLGGGAASSGGSNGFACNGRHLSVVGKSAMPPHAVYARNNYWDELPLEIATTLTAPGHIFVMDDAEVLLEPTLQGNPCP